MSIYYLSIVCMFINSVLLNKNLHMMIINIPLLIHVFFPVSNIQKLPYLSIEFYYHSLLNIYLFIYLSRRYLTFITYILTYIL